MYRIWLIFGGVLVIIGMAGLIVFLDQPIITQYDKIVLDEGESLLPEYKGTWLFKEGQQPKQITP